ncbi:probable cytochrome P450 305a1 isoform X1 [Diorhabda carinulata]|uniref:probable cytochrome P450 305a1 isoform X1 n=2 Tax=Diorhabda carinulata TaxID=1163345 RepID=UPI0025A21849|nr:probable cytochrome P450 305a1 isoform X1 [Diorhabda carinulata]
MYVSGPVWYPIVGNFHILKSLSKSEGGQHKAFAKLSKIYNSNIIGLKLGTEKLVVVSSFDLIKEVAYGHEFNGRPRNFFLKLRSMGTRKGIVGTDGEHWKIQRHFVVTHLRSLGFGLKTMDDMVREEVTELLSILKQSKENEIKIVPIISVSVLNVLWRSLSGSRLDRSDPNLQYLLDLLDKRALAFNMAGGVLNTFPWLRFISPEKSGYNLVIELNKELKALLMKTINAHYETWTDGRDDDLIYSFISEMKKSNGAPTTFTEDQLLMVCLDIFIAGSQTTSNTLDFAIMMMILYPEIQEKVRNTLNEAFDKTEHISYNCRGRVPYIEAVISEVQRYCHVIPVSGPKRTVKDAILGGYRIPKDTTLLFSFYSINNDESYWKDPEVFRPERFLDSEGRLSVPERFAPYGFGLRRCIGEVLARTSIFTIFGEILRNYMIVEATGSQKPTEIFVSGITLIPKQYEAKFIRISH